jgi:PAT family beta-lactamase induction signal transducer AmpG
MRSKRTAFVVLQMFSSGLPLGLVWIAIPDWMRSIGVDIRVVGLITLAQAPWTFKLLWAPLMDRYVPPFWGRRRGWMAVTQIALFVVSLMLAGIGQRPEAIWVGRGPGNGDRARVGNAGRCDRRLCCGSPPPG